MKKWLIIALALSVAGTALAGCSSGTTTQQEQVKVTRGDIVEGVKSDGALESTQTRRLSFGTGGQVVQINVSEGDRVAQGKVLGKLDTSGLERTVKTAELAVKSAGVDLEQAKQGVQSADIDLQIATDNYRKITYPYTYSTFAFDVPQALDSINTAQRQIGEALKNLQVGLSQDQYAVMLRQLNEAQDNLTDAWERLGRGQSTEVVASETLTVGNMWTLRAAQLSMEKAKVALDVANSLASKTALALERAKYDLDTAREMLDKAVITAPFDGTVSAVNIKAGESLTALDYSKPIFEMLDSAHMELRIDVDEIDVPTIKLGQEASITVEALPEAKLKGKVSFVVPSSKVVSGVVLYEVKVSFDVPESLGLKAGMSASATLIQAQKTGVLLVASRAITRDIQGNPVVKVSVGGQAEERRITTGISDNFYTEVVSGLQEGDTVIVERPASGG